MSGLQAKESDEEQVRFWPIESDRPARHGSSMTWGEAKAAAGSYVFLTLNGGQVIGRLMIDESGRKPYLDLAAMVARHNQDQKVVLTRKDLATFRSCGPGRIISSLQMTVAGKA